MNAMVMLWLNHDGIKDQQRQNRSKIKAKLKAILICVS